MPDSAFISFTFESHENSLATHKDSFPRRWDKGIFLRCKIDALSLLHNVICDYVKIKTVLRARFTR